MATLALRRPLDKVRDKAATFYLNHFAHRPAKLNPDWALSDAERRSIRVLWPAQYEWAPAERWMDTLIRRFSHVVRVELVDNIPQGYKGTVVFRFGFNGKVSEVAIGYSDYAPIDPECARRCALYFKMQYAREGYGLSHVVPGGYIPDSKRLYQYLWRIRRLRDEQRFGYDVYGRFSREYGTEIREQALSILGAQERFRFEGGMQLQPYQQFLEETARAKVCIDLPGRGDFCFRLVNYLAVGSCVVAYPHRNRLHVPLVPGKHIVYMKPDCSDLVDLCEYYLTHDKEREQIAQAAREYFDLYLHKDNLANYYLRTCVDMLTQSRMPARAATAR